MPGPDEHPTRNQDRYTQTWPLRHAVTRPSMRRPVAVKRYCGLVSSYLMFSFARISGDLWLSAAAVKAERGEFILSLDSRRGQP
jgi:hypothetical protein